MPETKWGYTAMAEPCPGWKCDHDRCGVRATRFCEPCGATRCDEHVEAAPCDCAPASPPEPVACDRCQGDGWVETSAWPRTKRCPDCAPGPPPLTREEADAVVVLRDLAGAMVLVAIPPHEDCLLCGSHGPPHSNGCIVSGLENIVNDPALRSALAKSNGTS